MRRTARRWLVGVAGVFLASAAAARGVGSGKSSTTPPATKNGGAAMERDAKPPRPPDFDPRPGYLGGMGAAQERGGPLGPRGDLAQKPSQAQAAVQPAGDVIRSWSSSDVRAARVQQAPDLNWAGAAAAPEQRRPNR